MDIDHARPRRPGLIEHAIGEAIGVFAAPAVRTDVMRLALRRADRLEVPERGPDVLWFIEQPLRSAAEQLLGIEAANAICAELAPMAAMVAQQEVSEVRSSWRPASAEPDIGARRVAMTDRAPASSPMVLVATSDPSAMDDLGLGLSGVATLHPVQDALIVLEMLGVEGCRIVVVDCRRPTVSVETLLALSPELPDGVRVVLWGEAPDLPQRLNALGAEMPEGWLCCGAGASGADVAAVCRVLLD